MGWGMRFGGALCLLTLAGCAPPPAPSVVVQTPTARPVLARKPVTDTPSPASAALRQHYRKVETDLVTQGLLRQDGGGPDVPFNARQLTENFIRIALYSEYVQRAGVLVAEQTKGRLLRWRVPVRIEVEFGDNISEKTRSKDRALVVNYARRLSRVSGHPISVVPSGGNFHVLILDEDARLAIGPRLRQLVPEIDATTLREIEQLNRDTFCLVSAFGVGQASAYTRAIAVIRAEHPDRLRTSCLHEEIAQGLGLSNDSPAARPSIFNDDEEFGLLTTHDEMLLKMLYDPRLKIGMTEEEARPIVTQIAAEFFGDS